MKLIIGHSGLVGTTLCQSEKYDYYFNSSNIDEFNSICKDGAELTLTCLPATKWMVNKNVTQDFENITKIIAIKNIKDSWKFDFEIPKKLEKFIAPKGSVTINGTSLTINEVSKKNISINVIKHTMENTIFQHSKIGDLVNLEIDLIARYLSQLIKNHD